MTTDHRAHEPQHQEASSGGIDLRACFVS